MTFFWDWDTDNILSPGAGSDEMMAFRSNVRQFVETEMTPFAAEWEFNKSFSPLLIQKAVAQNVYAPTWPGRFGGTLPAGASPWVRDFVLNDELAKSGQGGVLASAFVSLAIGLPPLTVGLAAGEAETLRIIRSVTCGQKRIALAVTEAFGGSDVAALRTTATRVGDTYVLNGEKTFITGGMSADYLTVAARTGETAISLFLIDSDLAGITRSRLETQGWRTSETIRIILENVVVSKDMLIGTEGAGFKPIMHNFNHERWLLAIHANRFARNCLEDAVAYAKVRKTFGKPLIEHQVIRHKIAEMARVILATHANCMQRMAVLADPTSSVASCAGRTALFKVQATKTFEFCAREASQILGGKSFLTGDGPGGRIERAYRDVRVYAIGGGSEEILLDLAIKQAKL